MNNNKQTPVIYKKQRFVEMWFTGEYTQKQLANKIGVSEATASNWVKAIKSQTKQLLNLQKSLLKKLQKAIYCDNTNTTEIYNLSIGLKEIRKQVEQLSKLDQKSTLYLLEPIKTEVKEPEKPP